MKALAISVAATAAKAAGGSSPLPSSLPKVSGEAPVLHSPPPAPVVETIKPETSLPRDVTPTPFLKSLTQTVNDGTQSVLYGQY